MSYEGSVDGKEVYKIEFNCQDIELHGIPDVNVHSDNSETKYFFITKAYGFIDIEGKTFKAQYSKEAVDFLNSEYELAISDAIKDSL